MDYERRLRESGHVAAFENGAHRQGAGERVLMFRSIDGRRRQVLAHAPQIILFNVLRRLIVRDHLGIAGLTGSGGALCEGSR